MEKLTLMSEKLKEQEGKRTEWTEERKKAKRKIRKVRLLFLIPFSLIFVSFFSVAYFLVTKNVTQLETKATIFLLILTFVLGFLFGLIFSWKDCLEAKFFNVLFCDENGEYKRELNKRDFSKLNVIIFCTVLYSLCNFFVLSSEVPSWIHLDIFSGKFLIAIASVFFALFSIVAGLKFGHKMIFVKYYHLEELLKN